MGRDFRTLFCEVGPVQPASAMGTFLRVWRSEWACLSRAQLANAIQLHLTGRKRVTAGVIRWWEAGQPPENAEELEALCLVMRAHDLTAPEVEQFRLSVFAACANRQYPELFVDADEAQRPDIDEAAEALWHQSIADTGLSCAYQDIVRRVVLLDELESALSRSAIEPGDERQRCRQRVAACFLRDLECATHHYAGRKPVELARRERSAREWLALSRGRIRSVEYERALCQQGSALYVCGVNLGETSVYTQMLELAEKPEQANWPLWRGKLVFAAAWLLSEEHQEGYTTLASQIARELAEVEARSLPRYIAEAHYTLCQAAIRQGAIREADMHLALLQEHAGSDPGLQAASHLMASALCGRAGDFRTAEETALRGLRLAESTPVLWGWVRDFTHQVQLAQDQTRPRRRGGRREGGKLTPEEAVSR